VRGDLGLGHTESDGDKWTGVGRDSKRNGLGPQGREGGIRKWPHESVKETFYSAHQFIDRTHC
jgi:hypothetical protein